MTEYIKSILEEIKGKNNYEMHNYISLQNRSAHLATSAKTADLSVVLELLKHINPSIYMWSCRNNCRSVMALVIKNSPKDQTLLRYCVRHVADQGVILEYIKRFDTGSLGNDLFSLFILNGHLSIQNECSKELKEYFIKNTTPDLFTGDEDDDRQIADNIFASKDIDLCKMLVENKYTFKQGDFEAMIEHLAHIRHPVIDIPN